MPTKHDPKDSAQKINWTLIGSIAIVAITLVTIVILMSPDFLKIDGGDKAPSLEIKRTQR
jgi:hypothetical protein